MSNSPDYVQLVAEMRSLWPEDSMGDHDESCWKTDERCAIEKLCQTVEDLQRQLEDELTMEVCDGDGNVIFSVSGDEYHEFIDAAVKLALSVTIANDEHEAGDNS